MRTTFATLCGFGAAILLSLALSGCPQPASYGPTITPIYAATNSGLYVFNGSSWLHYTNTGTSGGLASDSVSSIVVTGSGAGAAVYAGTSAGISRSYTSGSAWSSVWTTSDGLGSDTINGLFLSSANLYASTASGLSLFNYNNYAVPAWTNDAALAGGRPINCVYPFGSYLYVGSTPTAGTNPGLFVYNGTNSTPIFTFTPASIVAGSTKVNAIIVDGYQDVIAATDNGLNILYSNASPFQFQASPLISGKVVYGIYLDSLGNLYAASSAGLYNFGTGKIGLSGVACYCVYVDGAGTIYAGTATGLETSTDGGSTWTKILTTATAVNSVVATAPLYSF